MGAIKTAFRSAWRDFVTDGVPSSGVNKPNKSTLAALGDVIEAEVEGAAAGNVEAATWAVLDTIAGTRAGQPAVVKGPDAGTHTDPVVGGTVANTGSFAWSISPAGWRRTGDYNEVSQATIDGLIVDIAEKADQSDLDGKADQSDLDEEVAGREALISSYGSVDPESPAIVFVDADDREMFRVPRDFAGLMEPMSLETLGEGGRVLIVDADDRVLFDSGETSTATGDASDVTLLRPEYLKQTRMRLRRRERGLSGQLVLGIIGDSLSHATDYWTKAFSAALKTAYGDAGLGYFGFSSANAIDDGYTYTSPSGTWTTVDYDNPTPDICVANTSSSGARKRIAGPALPALSGANLYYIGTTDGVVRVRWNDGTWSSNITLDASGVGTLGIEALPDVPTSGAWTFDIEQVAGSISLGGVEFVSDADGVRINKLAISGSQAADWAAVNETSWNAGIENLGLDAVIILLGTNDRGYGRTPTEFASDMATIIDRVKAVSVFPDVLIVSPYQDELTSPAFPTSEFGAAVRQVAKQKRAAHLYLQPYFGAGIGDYGTTSALPLMSDSVHPDTTYGGPLMLDAILSAIDPKI